MVIELGIIGTILNGNGKVDDEIYVKPHREFLKICYAEL